MRTLSKLITIGLLGILLISCGAKENIRIGFVGTLSGSNSAIGVAMRDGLLLKVDEINNGGGIKGRQIEVIIKDDQNDHDLIREINQEFMDDGINIIFGHELSSKARPMLDVAKDKDVILISPTLSTYEMSELDDNFFRTITSNYDQGLALGNHAMDKSNNTLIIYDNKNAKFAEGVFEGYIDVFKGEHDFYAVTDPLTTVGEDIANIYIKGSFDSVLYVMNPNDVMYMSQVLFKNDLDVNIYSSNWGMATNALAEGGKAIEGAVFVSLMGNLDNPYYVSYKEAYLNKYNKEPEFASVYSYEAAVLLGEALKQSETLDFNSIKESLLSLGKQQGLLSELELDAYGDVSREIFIAIVENGEIVIQK